MSLILANAYGAVIVEADDDTQISVNKGKLPDTAPRPSAEEPLEEKPRPIVLGPKTRPPLPTSVQLVRAVGGARPSGIQRYVIRLDRDVAGTHLSEDAVERVHQAIASCDGKLELDVYIPPQRSFEVEHLSSHIASLDTLGLHSLKLRVAGDVIED